MILNGFLKAAIFSCPQKHILCTQKYYFIRNQGYLGKILRYPQKHILCTQPKYCKEIQFRSETGRSFIRSGGKSKQWGNCPPPFFNQGEILPPKCQNYSISIPLEAKVKKGRWSWSFAIAIIEGLEAHDYCYPSKGKELHSCS